MEGTARMSICSDENTAAAAMLGLLAGENQGLDIPLHDVAAAALESNKENLRTTGRSSKAKGATQNRGISLRNDNKTDDEKPFKCQFPGCNKRFALAGYLKQHQICHSDARPFKCSHCDAKFARRYQLRVHERAKHTNERPYKCTHPGCNKTFTTASSALDHVRRTHQTEPEFQCQHCLKKFFTPTSARSHACPKFPGGTGNDSRSGGAPGTRKRRRNPDIERIVDPEEFDRGIKVCTVASTSVAAADGKDKARGAKKEKKQKTSQPPMEKDVSVDRRVESACAVAASGPESATRSTRNRKAKAKRDENGTARIQTESVAPAAIARGRENTGSATRVIPLKKRFARETGSHAFVPAPVTSEGCVQGTSAPGNLVATTSTDKVINSSSRSAFHVPMQTAAGAPVAIAAELDGAPQMSDQHALDVDYERSAFPSMVTLPSMPHRNAVASDVGVLLAPQFYPSAAGRGYLPHFQTDAAAAAFVLQPPGFVAMENGILHNAGQNPAVVFRAPQTNTLVTPQHANFGLKYLQQQQQQQQP